MAQFRGIIRGSRGEASRLGSKTSGLQVIGDGWNIGVKVWLGHNQRTGKDFVNIVLTSGSNGHEPIKELGCFVEGEI